MTKAHFCDFFNIKKHVVLKRLKNGWDLKDIIKTPIRGKNE